MPGQAADILLLVASACIVLLTLMAAVALAAVISAALEARRLMRRVRFWRAWLKVLGRHLIE